jgi:16S rRNA (cytosine1402-N4)-methyltransferase
MSHEPVLLGEVLEFLNVRPGGCYLDATVGSAGHAAAILERAEPGGRILGIDRDREALARAERTLAGRPADRTGTWQLEHGRFSDLARLARERGMDAVDGVVFDLGISSDQVDTASRGFSFLQDGPLDMRMDRDEPVTAAALLETLAEEELADMIWELGEERKSRAIARAIVNERARAPIRTTADLASLVERVKGGRHGRIHPATQTFQAARMRVNREPEQIRLGLDAALDVLRPGGRLVAISFHSLEDRAVKQFMVGHAGRWESLPAGGQEWRGLEPAVKILTRKPVRPSDGEVERNPRARSAKLRAAERS